MPEPKEVEVVTDLDKFETRHPAPVPAIRTDSPMDAVIVAMEKGYSPEFIEKMMDLQERHEKNEAKKAYDKAMAAFRSEPIFISKDLKNDQYNSYYTSKGNLINTAAPILGKYGFSHRFDFKGGEPMTMTCILTHANGHSESVSIPGPLDKSGSKNSLQQIKSTITYLEIATFEAVTGLASQGGSLDDDGNGAGKPVEPVKFITIEQAQAIAKGVKQAGVDKEKFLEFHNIEKFEELTEVGLKKAQAQVARRIKENEKAENADN